jgi:hypothetical protein
MSHSVFARKPTNLLLKEMGETRLRPVPGSLVPVLGIAFCLVLMFSLPAEKWLRLILWLLLGFAVYFGHGRYHSVLARMRDREIQAGSLSG